MTTNNQISSAASLTAPLAGQNRLVIVGATRMVGGYALRCALEHPSVGHVTAIGRRKLGISHIKLKEVLHQDFADCSVLPAELSGHDAAVFCLGAYTAAVPDAELRRITVGYTIEFARVLHASSPDAAVSFLSGSGADPTGRSRMLLHVTRVRPRRHCSRLVFPTSTFSGPRTYTLRSHGKNPISVTV